MVFCGEVVVIVWWIVVPKMVEFCQLIFATFSNFIFAISRFGKGDKESRGPRAGSRVGWRMGYGADLTGICNGFSAILY
jgi:hypothetical protein